MANLFAQLSSVPVRLDMIMIKRHFKAFKMVIRSALKKAFLDISCQGIFRRHKTSLRDCKFIFLSVYLYLFLYLCFSSVNNIQFRTL